MIIVCGDFVDSGALANFVGLTVDSAALKTAIVKPSAVTLTVVVAPGFTEELGDW